LLVAVYGRGAWAHDLGRKSACAIA
jgi:hypothetical protein